MRSWYSPGGPCQTRPMAHRTIVGALVAALTLLATPAQAAVIRGGDGPDRLVGDHQDDVLLGGRGDDELKDLHGRNVLAGGPGADALEGGGGVDRLSGGPGRDYLVDYLGGDLLRGGPGDDRAVVDSRGTRPHGPTRLHLGRGDDTVLTRQDDRLDVIDCGPGHDVVEWLADSGAILDPADRLVDCEVVREYLGA